MFEWNSNLLIWFWAVFSFINSFAAKYRFQLHLHLFFPHSVPHRRCLLFLFGYISHLLFKLSDAILLQSFHVFLLLPNRFTMFFLSILLSFAFNKCFAFRFLCLPFFLFDSVFRLHFVFAYKILTQSIALFSHWALFMDDFLFESKLSVWFSVSFFRMPMIRWQLTIQTQPQYLQPRARASSLLLV